jgi:hypothetical protein
MRMKWRRMRLSLMLVLIAFWDTSMTWFLCDHKAGSGSSQMTADKIQSNKQQLPRLGKAGWLRNWRELDLSVTVCSLCDGQSYQCLDGPLSDRPTDEDFVTSFEWMTILPMSGHKVCSEWQASTFPKHSKNSLRKLRRLIQWLIEKLRADACQSGQALS